MRLSRAQAEAFARIRSQRDQPATSKQEPINSCPPNLPLPPETRTYLTLFILAHLHSPSSPLCPVWPIAKPARAPDASSAVRPIWAAQHPSRHRMPRPPSADVAGRRRERAEQLSSAPALVLAVERDNAFSRLAALEEHTAEVMNRRRR